MIFGTCPTTFGCIMAIGENHEQKCLWFFSYAHSKLSAGKLVHGKLKHKRSTYMNSFRVISNVKLIVSNVCMTIRKELIRCV